MSYVQRVLIAFDIFANVVTGGEFDETISARVYRASVAHHGWARVWRWPGILLAKLLLGALNWIQRNHGANAVANDLARAQAIVKLEQSVAAPVITAARRIAS